MKISLHNYAAADAKSGEIEAGPIPSSRRNRCSNLKLFKWLITINLVVLLLFCVYALLSLYQLESVLRSNRDNDLFISNREDTTSESASNDSTIVREWQNDNTTTSHDLRSFLRAITSIVKNFIESHNITSKQDTRIRAAGSDSTMIQSKLIVTNLTHFEAHMLKEFTKLMVLKDRNARVRRTVKGGKDESGCDLEFTLETRREQPMLVMVKPARTKVENMSHGKNKVEVGKTKECTFNIVYKKN